MGGKGLMCFGVAFGLNIFELRCVHCVLEPSCSINLLLMFITLYFTWSSSVRSLETLSSVPPMPTY